MDKFFYALQQDPEYHTHIEEVLDHLISIEQRLGYGPGGRDLSNLQKDRYAEVLNGRFIGFLYTKVSAMVCLTEAPTVLVLQQPVTITGCIVASPHKHETRLIHAVS